MAKDRFIASTSDSAPTPPNPLDVRRDSLRDTFIHDIGERFAKMKSAVKVMTASNALDELARVDMWILTGIYGLDYILSRGKGLPTGRAIEIFGNEGSGKTAFCEYLAGVFKRLGSPIHYLDYEQSIDLNHLACYGVTGDDIITPDLPTLEDGWDYINNVLNILAERREARKAKDLPDPPSLFLWDSLAQAVPKAELEEDEHEDSHIGLVARSMAKGFRKHTRGISHSDALLVFINQVRDNIGGPTNGPQTTTPGGRAAKFAYSLRINLAKFETSYRGETAIGHIIKVTTRKNKHAPYPQECRLVLSYTTGIDVDHSNFLFLRENKFIQPAGGAGYKWKGQQTTFKRKEFGVWAREHADLVSDGVKSIYANLDKYVADAAATAADADDT